MQPSNRYFALFFTTTGAMKFNRFLKNQNIFAELKPVPRKLSSSCAAGVEFVCGDGLSKLLNEDMAKVFEIYDNQYLLRYENKP